MWHGGCHQLNSTRRGRGVMEVVVIVDVAWLVLVILVIPDQLGSA